MDRKNEDRKVVLLFLASLLFVSIISVVALSGTMGFRGMVGNNSLPTQEITDETVPTVININEADKETLMRLSGVGEVLAERIIAYREQNGVFETVEDLVQVKGIGEKLLEKFRPYITV